MMHSRSHIVAILGLAMLWAPAEAARMMQKRGAKEIITTAESLLEAEAEAEAATSWWGRDDSKSDKAEKVPHYMQRHDKLEAKSSKTKEEKAPRRFWQRTDHHDTPSTHSKNQGGIWSRIPRGGATEKEDKAPRRFPWGRRQPHRDTPSEADQDTPRTSHRADFFREKFKKRVTTEDDKKKPKVLGYLGRQVEVEVDDDEEAAAHEGAAHEASEGPYDTYADASSKMAAAIAPITYNMSMGGTFW